MLHTIQQETKHEIGQASPARAPGRAQVLATFGNRNTEECTGSPVSAELALPEVKTYLVLSALLAEFR